MLNKKQRKQLRDLVKGMLGAKKTAVMTDSEIEEWTKGKYVFLKDYELEEDRIWLIPRDDIDEILGVEYLER